MGGEEEGAGGEECWAQGGANAAADEVDGCAGLGEGKAVFGGAAEGAGAEEAGGEVVVGGLLGEGFQERAVDGGRA